MSKEEKYKLALFVLIRNSIVMPNAEELGMSIKEVNRMSYLTMTKIMEGVNYELVKRSYEEAEEGVKTKDG